MPSIRSSLQSRLAARVMILAAVFVCLFGIATWADEHIVQPVNCDYSTASFADQMLIKCQDRGNGTLPLNTQAEGYSEYFNLIEGKLSGWHAAGACSLTRDMGVASGGSIWQGGE